MRAVVFSSPSLLPNSTNTAHSKCIVHISAIQTCILFAHERVNIFTDRVGVPRATNKSVGRACPG